MGLLDELFSKILDFLGGLGGVIVERGSSVEDVDISYCLIVLRNRDK